MSSGRGSFVTEFLLQELLAALGAHLVASSASTDCHDSFSENLSEETESQSALEVANGDKSRVMLVRRTNTSQQTVTLVDREYDVKAFIPDKVLMELKKTRGYHSLGRLRGSVVRVTKYHFTTLARCLAMSQQSRETLVSVPDFSRNKARVYLWVDALDIVEDNDLAIQTLPQVSTHPLVMERLQTLSDAELEKQLMINQGLPPLEATRSERFDAERPLLEEDCVIPEEQEQELDMQDEWGPPTTIERQPTDSELIEENGSVPMPDSQVVHDSTLPKKLLSTQKTMASSEEFPVTSATLSVTISENSSITLSEEVSVTPSLDSQGYLFQQENIRETFVVGSDLESSDTDSEHARAQEGKRSASSTLKSHEHVYSSRRHPVHSSPIPSIPKATQNSWVTVDLTKNSPEKAPLAIPASKKKAIEELEVETETNGLQNEASGNAAPSLSAHSPPRTHCPNQKQKPSAGWTTSLLRLVGLGTSAAKASLLCTQSADEEAGDLAENENDHNITQMLDPTEEEEKEAEPTESEDLISSPATVILQDDVDIENDDHAFEYEGMLSDDIVSPRSAEHTQEADSAPFSAEGAKAAPTPKKMPALKKNTTSTECKTPSPSAEAATSATEKRSEPADRQTPALISAMKEKNPEMLLLDSSHPASPLNTNDPVLQVDPAAAYRSLVKSPSEPAISVGPSSSRTGFSAVKSRGIKRRRQQNNAPSITVHAKLPVSQPRVQKNAKLRFETQKHRREILSTQAGSLSPQFEQSVFPRRPLQSEYGNGVADSYSLNALCRTLDSRIRDLTEEDQARTSRKPRRAWKRYENLFPPLNMNMTHMAEAKVKCRQGEP